MFGTFILGLAAGWAAPHAGPKIKAALEGVLPEDLRLPEAQWPQMSLAICLLVAAIVSAMLSRAYGVPLTLGAVLGVMAPSLLDKWRAGKTPDYDS